jgi:hypothetical protein
VASSVPCSVPLIDPAQVKQTVKGTYYGSAKPRFHSASRSFHHPMKQELGTGVKYIPPGPPQGGGQKPTKVSSGKLER